MKKTARSTSVKMRNTELTFVRSSWRMWSIKNHLYTYLKVYAFNLYYRQLLIVASTWLFTATSVSFIIRSDISLSLSSQHRATSRCYQALGVFLKITVPFSRVKL